VQCRGKINVTEYSPKKVKQSITGNGNAAKEQVWKMLQQTLSIEEKPQYFERTDALQLHCVIIINTSSRLVKIAKGFKGWEDFLAKNQEPHP
jgi:crossover junction endodeoxyribonuclease RuvC